MPHDDGSLFARTLVAIHLRGRTGVLEVRSPEVTTLLYFERGVLVFAEQGTLGETLGRMLVREGRLTQEQYAKVIERMTASLVDSETMRFGEAAVALGFLSPADVHDALAMQVRRKLLHCFQLESAECVFDADEEPLSEVGRFPSDVLPLVMDGVRRHYDSGRSERVLAAFLDRTAALEGSAADVATRLELHPAEARFVRSIDGTRRLRDVIAGSDLDSVLTAQVCAGLVLTGQLRLVEVADARAPGPAEEVARPVDVARPAAASALAAELRRRGRVIRRSSIPPPADEQRARLVAEQHYQAARRQMAYDAWAKAHDELARAVKLCPEMLEYELARAWAAFRSDAPKDEAEGKRARDALEDLAARALKEDRENAFAWHVRGQVAALSGDDERAFKAFRLAQRLDSDDAEAARWVRLLAGRLGKKKS